MFKNRIKDMVIGFVVCGIISTSLVGFAGMESIQAFFNDIKIVVDGVEKIPADDMKPFVYNGRTYVSLRFVGEAIGKPVAWDAEKSTVVVGNSTITTSVVADDEKIITSKNNKLQVTVPNTWSHEEDENLLFQIVCENKEKGTGTIMSTIETKNPLIQDLTIEEYCSKGSNELKTILGIKDPAKSTKIEKINVDGVDTYYKEMWVEIQDSKGAIVLMYSVFDTGKSYVSSCIISNNIEYENNLYELKKILHSVKYIGN